MAGSVTTVVSKCDVKNTALSFVRVGHPSGIQVLFEDKPSASISLNLLNGHKLRFEDTFLCLVRCSRANDIQLRFDNAHIYPPYILE